MTEPSKLPPLPDWFDGYSEADKLVVQVYARRAVEAAIEADRAALQSQDREDAARIDFIEANPGWLRVCRLGHPTKQQWACVSPFTNYEFDGFKTAREAIDHARRIGGERE